MSVDDKIKALNDKYFDILINPITSIYVDLEILQDFKLGALFSTLTVKEELEYIYSQMLDYNSRVDFETAKYFPILNKTDDDLNSIIHNHPFEIAAMAPWTIVYDNFYGILQFIRMHNAAAAGKHAETIHVTVNVVDIDYPLELFESWTNSIKEIITDVEFHLTNTPRYEESVDFYEKYKMFFLYDHEKFFNNVPLVDMISNDKNLCTKIVYTIPYVNPEMKMDKQQYSKGLSVTASMLNMICDFFYMPNGIPINKFTETQ